MKLYISPASPYARKCSIVAREKKIISSITEVLTMPLESAPELLASNPLSQVPSLVLDNGTSVFDSPIICAYLHAMSQLGPDLYGKNDIALNNRRLEAIGDAITEPAVKIAFENRRPLANRSQEWLDKWFANIDRTMEYAEKEINDLGKDEFNIGLISIACALTYIEFRQPQLEWKTRFPNLCALQARLEARPSFKDTLPK